MPAVDQSKSYVTFVGGLNTEATALNFPENAAQELDNLDLVRTGEIKRRLGVDFESGYEVTTNSILDEYFKIVGIGNSEWRAVNGKGDINFLVVQVGMVLYFHDLGAEPTSANLRGSIDLSGFKTESDADNQLMDVTYGKGVATICNRGMDPVYIEFNETLETFSATRIKMEIRDFDGLDDELLIDERPSASLGYLDQRHYYNLLNQGWPKSTNVAQSRGGADGVLIQNPVYATGNLVGYFPSNADMIWASKASIAKSGKEEVVGSYSPWGLKDFSSGNTLAPRGHFIYDTFNRDRALVSGLTLPAGSGRTTTARPSATAFYAGRMWYAGIRDRAYTGDIYFSQLLTGLEKIGKCYQDQDPTAEDLNNLLATDGGIIHIADAGEVYRMVVQGQDLVIGAANGVWAVTGALGGNFKADDFSVRKLSDQGIISRDAIVQAEGALLWWSQGGIWVMKSGQIDDKFTIDRITKDTIQTLYEEIPQGAKVYSRGFYDEFSKRIMWMYNDNEDYDGINFRFRYNRALLLDLTLGAFYTYTIEDLDSDTPFVSAMSMKYPGNAAVLTYDIVLNLDTIELGADTIVQDITFTQYANNKIKLLTFVQNEDLTWDYTFSEFNSRTFNDWSTWDEFQHGAGFEGESFSSVIQTGWQDFQAVLNGKHITHLTSFFKKTEDGYTEDEDGNLILDNPSGALVSTRWEWTDVDVNRWTTPTQAYRLNQFYIPEDDTDPFNYGYTVVRSKLRMRGQGHAFSIRYVSVPGYDMHLIGFAINLRGATKL